jgi:MoaA/NifB/PqqE/SkfB family radical SAM enzyme
MTPSLNELRGQIERAAHQGSVLKRPANFFYVIREYWPLGQYMLWKFGWRSWYTFWFTKLFVVDEGGEYGFLNRLHRRYPSLLRRPYKIEMEHTTVCNKKCIFCEHTFWHEKSTSLSFEQFRRIIDPLPGLKWINITGEGSSFLNRNFIKMIEYARRRHLNVNFVDEFDFFNEDMARKVIELGINSIYVSFDGATKEIYEKVKEGCSYEKALANIRRLLRLKEEMQSPFPVIHFRYIITTLNYHEMPDFIELISTLPNRGAMARVEFVGLLSFAGIEQYYLPIDRIPEDIIRRTYENAIKHKINLHFSHESGKLPSMTKCCAWAEPYILIGGEVISCCAIIMSNRRQFLRENSFGNVYEKPISTIWNSGKYRAFRQMVVTAEGQVPVSCNECRAFDTKERASRHGIWDFNTATKDG